MIQEVTLEFPSLLSELLLYKKFCSKTQKYAMFFIAWFLDTLPHMALISLQVYLLTYYLRPEIQCIPPRFTMSGNIVHTPKTNAQFLLKYSLMKESFIAEMHKISSKLIVNKGNFANIFIFVIKHSIVLRSTSSCL